MLSHRESQCVTLALVVGLAIAAIAFLVGWNTGRVTGFRQAERVEQNWWTCSSQADAVARWQEHHLPADEG